jgi:hypothetical protein
MPNRVSPSSLPTVIRRSIAHAIGHVLEVRFPKDLPPDAASVDDDSLCLDACGRFIEELAAMFPDRRVAVHSFDFDNATPSRTAGGLAVARTFRVDLLHALAPSTSQSEAA